MSTSTSDREIQIDEDYTMKQLRDIVWQRRGTSCLWDDEALGTVCLASEVWSLRQFIQARGHWPDDLPSNDSNTLVAAELDACLDLDIYWRLPMQRAGWVRR